MIGARTRRGAFDRHRSFGSGPIDHIDHIILDNIIDRNADDSDNKHGAGPGRAPPPAPVDQGGRLHPAAGEQASGAVDADSEVVLAICGGAAPPAAGAGAGAAGGVRIAGLA